MPNARLEYRFATQQEWLASKGQLRSILLNSNEHNYSLARKNYDKFRWWALAMCLFPPEGKKVTREQSPSRSTFGEFVRIIGHALAAIPGPEDQRLVILYKNKLSPRMKDNINARIKDLSVLERSRQRALMSGCCFLGVRVPVPLLPPVAGRFDSFRSKPRRTSPMSDRWEDICQSRTIVIATTEWEPLI